MVTGCLVVAVDFLNGFRVVAIKLSCLLYVQLCSCEDVVGGCQGVAYWLCLVCCYAVSRVFSVFAKWFPNLLSEKSPVSSGA